MHEKVKAKVLVTLWCPTLSDPIDCNSPGSSVRGILQTSTGVGGHSLSPGDLPNLDSGLLYCRRILYHLSHEGSPNRASYLTIYIYIHVSLSSVQSLIHVQLFATLWTEANQDSLSITNSWSLLKLMST